MPTIIDVWEASRNANSVEGRGPMLTIGLFTKKKDAEMAAKGWGVMGCGDGDVESKQIKVYASFEEYYTSLSVKSQKDYDRLGYSPSAQTKRERALGKLTPEERVLLGIKE